MLQGIDAHIHLDMYDESRARFILMELASSNVKAIVAVSRHLESCKATKRLQESDQEHIRSFGYHPEQLPPSEAELNDLKSWMIRHAARNVSCW